MKVKMLVDVATTAAIGALAVTMLWDRIAPKGAGASLPVAAQVPKEPISLGANVKGRGDAPVVLVEFSDFECPYCRRFSQDTLPTLVERFVETGQLAVAFRHFPNPSSHPHAMYASEAAECAAQQGRFWDVHDALFSTPAVFDRAFIKRQVVGLGLHNERFDDCMLNGPGTSIDEDTRDALTLGISGTPAFVLGRRKGSSHMSPTSYIGGARPVEVFAEVVTALLSDPTPVGLP